MRGLVLGVFGVALVLGGPARAQLSGSFQPNGATFNAYLTDNSQSPSVTTEIDHANWTYANPGAVIMSFGNAGAGMIGGDPTAQATVTGPNFGQAASIVSGTPLYQAFASTNYSFAAVGPAGNVTFDFTANVSVTGVGNYYTIATVSFDDAAAGPRLWAFQACSTTSTQTCSYGPVSGGGGTGISGSPIGGLPSGSATYSLLSGTLDSDGSGAQSAGGTLEFTMPANYNKSIVMGVTVWTYDDASYATALADPVITINTALTPNANQYTLVQSANLDVPEPASAALLAAGLGALRLARQRGRAVVQGAGRS